MGTKQRIGMGLLIGLGFKLGFISILHLPVPRAGLESPLPVPRLVTSFVQRCWPCISLVLRGLLTIKEESISI